MPTGECSLDENQHQYEMTWTSQQFVPEYVGKGTLQTACSVHTNKLDENVPSMARGEISKVTHGKSVNCHTTPPSFGGPQYLF